MKENPKVMLFLILVPLLLAVFCGLLFAIVGSLTGGEFVDTLVDCTVMSYLLFGAGFHVGVLLKLILGLGDDYYMKFGLALYYGTAFLGKIISELIHGNSWSYIVAFVVVSLLCYIYWLKKEKEE